MFVEVSKTEKIPKHNFENILNLDQLKNKIIFFYTDLDQPENIIWKYYAVLPSFEQKKIDAYKVKAIKDRQILLKGLLHVLLGCYLKTDPQSIEFEYNKFGKPFMPDHPKYKNICFNISHSNNIAVYGFTQKRNIGVDVEKVRELPDMNGVIDLCFSDSEKKWFNMISSQDKNKIFYKIWTSKEAYLKAIGTGLSFSPDKISTGLNSEGDIIFENIEGDENPEKWRLDAFSINPHFTSAIVAENKNSEIKYFKIDPRDIAKLLSDGNFEYSGWVKVPS